MVSMLKGLNVQKSRFAPLSLDLSSESEEDSSPWQQAQTRSKPPKKNTAHSQIHSEETKGLSKNAKKRARKRRNKSTSSDHGANDGNEYVQVESNTKISVESQDDQYEEVWKKKNEEAVEEEFQEELRKALMLSKIEAQKYEKMLKEMKIAEEKAVVSSSQSSKTSKKGVKLSLQELHKLPSPSAEGIVSTASHVPPKLPLRGTDQTSSVDANDPLVHSPMERLGDIQFSPLMEDIEAEVRKEMTTERGSHRDKPPSDEDLCMLPRIAQLEDELERKDKVLAKLKKENNQLKKSLTEVKERNQSLCTIMSQGEFSKKAELLKQVNDLSTLKDDLALEVEILNSSLEQEKSKNKVLKIELTKLQNLLSRTKNSS